MKRAAALVTLGTLLALAPAATPGCLGVEHGIVVELRVAALPDGAASMLTLPDGTSFRLDEGEITIRDVTLLPCAGAVHQARLDAWRRVLSGVPIAGPAVAYAHDHGATGAVLAGPFRVSLADEASTLGAFTPPPGEYCGLHVRLGPQGEGSEAPWSARARAHTPAGVELTALSDLTTFAHVVPPEPLDLTTPGIRVVAMSLYEATGFTGSTFAIADPRAFGDALLTGITAQADARLLVGER